MRLVVSFLLVLCTANFSSAPKIDEIAKAEVSEGWWIIGVLCLIVALSFTLAMCSCFKKKPESKYQLPKAISDTKVKIDLWMPEADSKGQNYQGQSPAEKERINKMEENTFQTQGEDIATKELFNQDLTLNPAADPAPLTLNPAANNDMQTAIGPTQQPGGDQPQSLSLKTQEDQTKRNKPLMSTFTNPQAQIRPQVPPSQYYMTPAQQQQLYYNNYMYNPRALAPAPNPQK